MEDKQKVLLIGANGFIGQELTKELIKHFHVKALIRSAPKFGINSIFLKFVNGDASNQEVLENNLDDIDLVVSSFGVPDNQNPNGGITKFAKTLVKAMNNKVNKV
jgi:putative NADH-flavin reductase